jgi:hypothetical protein
MMSVFFLNCTLQEMVSFVKIHLAIISKFLLLVLLVLGCSFTLGRIVIIFFHLQNEQRAAETVKSDTVVLYP